MRNRSTIIAAPMSTDPDQDFLQAADQVLHSIQRRLDEFDPDEIEADLASGVLKITFPDRRNCILNRQAAAQQIWLAEGASAWHFLRTANTWSDTKGRGDLETILGDILSRRLGRTVRL